MLAHIHDGADFAVILVVLAVGIVIGAVYAIRAIMGGGAANNQAA